MTAEQINALPAALKSANEYVEANGLLSNLTTYMEVREADGGNYWLTLFTTDASGAEVDVNVTLYTHGVWSPPRGIDGVRA